MSDTTNPFKSAADALRKAVQDNGSGKLKAGHAHEIVAAACNYGSKAALDADGYELYPDDPSSYPEPDEAVIAQRIEQLDQPGVNPSFAHQAVGIIQETVTPECSYCDCNERTWPVETGESWFQHQLRPQYWICASCKKDENLVGTCWCCEASGEFHIYDRSALNSANECPEHAGESWHTDEEQEDLDSFVEYLENH